MGGQIEDISRDELIQKILKVVGFLSGQKEFWGLEKSQNLIENSLHNFANITTSE